MGPLGRGKIWAGRNLVMILAAGLVLLGGCGVSRQAREQAAVHSRMGFGHLRQGDSTAALRDFLEAQRLNPKDPQIHYGLGWAYSQKGMFAEAMNHYREALRLDPQFTDAHNTLGLAYLEMSRFEEAIREFETALKDLLYPTPYSLLNNLGWAHYRNGDREKAIECYQKAVAQKPDFGMAFYNMGLAYRDLKQTQAAIAVLRTATRLEPGLQEAHFQLGLLLLQAGERAEAKKAFQEVIRLQPQSERARQAQRHLDQMAAPP
ncbi:MAG: tetratricopeptide repeat protein [Deltaproteobacteria bacterium]|nr:tetratricopeptide repeat protein [Deltaproteobacteria bacterium]